MIEVNLSHPESRHDKTVEASEILDNELFECADGYLFLKLYDGAISISDDGDTPSVYTMEELRDDESYPNFQECAHIPGKVTISVEAEVRLEREPREDDD